MGQALCALDVSQGIVKLTLYESSGRFCLSCLTDQKKNTYTPFILDKDPRTSFLAISVGNKVYRMGESSEFRQSTERSEKGARFVWTSSMISVVEEFSFVSSAGSSQADGIRIDLVIKSASDKTISVGVRYLSPLGGDKDGFGLMWMLSGGGVTAADRTVFANWKRLSDASWGYETSATRNFNLLPYSVNDSAVSMYWDQREIAKDQELRIVSLLGRYSPEGFSTGESSALTQTPTQPTSSSTTTAGTTAAAASGISEKPGIRLTDLDTLNALITRMDQRISSGEPISDDELERFRQALEELKTRAAAASGTGK
jgi:hypothetical protein